MQKLVSSKLKYCLYTVHIKHMYMLYTVGAVLFLYMISYK